MTNRSRSQNALLVEIMIAVLFFALCATVILETFVSAWDYSSHAGVHSRAQLEVQDLAERIYAAEDVQLVLEEAGFSMENGLWQQKTDEYRMEVELDVHAESAGELRTALIRVVCKDEKIIAELPSARYIPGEVPA